MLYIFLLISFILVKWFYNVLFRWFRLVLISNAAETYKGPKLTSPF